MTLALLLLCMISASFAQITLTRNQCANQLVVEISNPNFNPPDPFFTPLHVINCESNTLITHRMGASIGSVIYNLQEKENDNSWTTVSTAQFSSKKHIFSYNFTQGVTYRVEIRLLPIWGGHVAVTDNCVLLGSVVRPNATAAVFFTN